MIYSFKEHPIYMLLHFPMSSRAVRFASDLPMFAELDNMIYTFLSDKLGNYIECADGKYAE